MNRRILNSIINITGQRDVDSLNHGLLLTFAELLPLSAITLYKLIGGNPENAIEKAVYKVTNGKIQIKGKQNDEIDRIKEKRYLNECLLNKEELSYQNSNKGKFYLLIPLICGEKIIGVIEIEAPIDLENFRELINSIKRIYENNFYILNMSERDKLTGLFNRHCFDAKLNRLLQLQKDVKQLSKIILIEDERRQQISGLCAWLIIIDIDHFKKINDTFGHVCGDEVLLKLSRIMKAFFRSSDLLFRFGGEEFVIILEPIPYEMAENKLELFRNKVANSNFPLIGRITISGGYAKINNSDYPISFIEHADQALYYAKNKGRNCICNYELLVEKGELLPHAKNGEIEVF